MVAREEALGLVVGLGLLLCQGCAHHSTADNFGARVRSDAPCTDWDHTLALELKKMVHRRAKDVPKFPHDDPQLREPSGWPNTIRIEGVPCSLRVQESGGDWVKDVRSLAEVSSTSGVCLYYESAPWKGWQSRRGPFYCWYVLGSKRWLHERSWGGPIYQYYPSGRLY